MMRTWLNKLSTGWLVLALILAPLQAVAAPLAPVAMTDCPMRAGQHQSVSSHHPPAHDLDQTGTQHHCPQCADDSCDDGQCGSHSCCATHTPPGMTGFLMVFHSRSISAFYPDLHEKVDSRPLPPLFRPPA
jgi:hypothetical protein